ncbi:hypothetical protein [Flavobacterium sp. LM4]|uniref:hypothetical protein n=1 Tax=Flavobacterium sp. LM4 TaxID=1938609 RepID=UPI0009922418|nr:hypothetical protein [Flavobacterium sp. LM4]OOV19183.1 hypothetical protein BXU10_05800 [Flavobacterium sp. LM4]
MKRILMLLWSLFLIGCSGQTKKNNLDEKADIIKLNFKNASVALAGINSVNDNVKEDFNIKNDGTKILMQPAFLESDLLDGKELEFSNNNVKNIKITFSYDAVFYGEEKNKTTLGFQRDTTIVLKIENKKVQIPIFEDIKKTVFKKFEKKEIYDVAYLVNRNYFNKIVENYEVYGGKDSPDYKLAVAFLKSNKKSQKLEDLFINIDYIKFNIEFEDNSKLYSSIVFDRMFQNYVFSEKEKKSNIDGRIPKGFYVLDSTVINLKKNGFKILALEKDGIKNKDNAQHNSNPIIILQKKSNQYQKVNDNYNLIFKYDDNCPADGYGGIVSKNNYFTVQQIFCVDFLFVNSYTTFKIDENTGNINLHKYGEEYTDRSNTMLKIPSKTWSIKDFGIVKFESVNEGFLINLRNKKPLK